jgi:hypothetical protein
MSVVLRSALHGVLIAAALGTAPAAHGQGTPRLLHVRVTDAGGAPLPGLRPTDFELREGGALRTVTRAAPAASVMRIALLVDNGPLMIPIIKELRAGLEAFFVESPARHEIVFATLGRRFAVREPLTDNYAKLKKSASVLLAEHDGPTMLLDGMLEADEKYFAPTRDRLPMMVIVTTDNMDRSKVRQDVLNRRIDEILRRGVMVDAIVLTHPGESGNERDICTNLTQSTGGHLDILTGSASALPERLRAAGARLADAHRNTSTAYEIEYLSEATVPEPLQISVSRPGARIEFANPRGR